MVAESEIGNLVPRWQKVKSRSFCVMMAENGIRSLLDDKSSYIKASVDRRRIKIYEFTGEGRILQRNRQYGILETYN